MHMNAYTFAPLVRNNDNMDFFLIFYANTVVSEKLSVFLQVLCKFRSVQNFTEPRTKLGCLPHIPSSGGRREEIYSFTSFLLGLGFKEYKLCRLGTCVR